MSKANPQPLYHVAQVPDDPRTTSYTRFFFELEPTEYTNWIDECESWKKTCFIGDWSPLMKLKITGPDALSFFSSISVNSFAKFDIGQAKHAVLCNVSGKIMGDGVLMRISEESFIYTSGPGVAWAMYQFAKGNYNAKAEVVTEDYFAFQVQGPNSLLLLEELTGESLRDIGFMRFRQSSINGMTFNVLRQGMAGELGYELHGESHNGVEIYNTILKVGERYGIRRLGGRSKMVNHVEACFPTPTVDYLPAMFGDDQRDFLGVILQSMPYFMEWLAVAGSAQSRDFTTYARTPFELGWGKNVKFDHEFIGRAALEEEAANPRRTMVTLVWNGEDVSDVSASFLSKDAEPYTYMEMPRNLLGLTWMDKVLVDGHEIGVSSSRCYSYTFREMLSLCVIDQEYATPGTEVVVVWGHPGTRQKHIRARVAPAPYKKDNRRIDVTGLPSAQTV
ncbi:aminomethyl transferase family protein [Pseudomonas sp. BN414]|uniref:aminomethyl transferase family protein n=1 Tax=unclassified Pseudomonas TaxID=196821 RepID=UPI002458450C|nr:MULTISPECIES: aminomethyl transferase family protein [unclassified Pseudomonas]MDH4568232.1 aminomethyl transferase family protein [Pseudomonas sp. BN414]MDH4580709.1 aminomethyl transferase family protein [Pseudomonas sp. BN415]